jgi:hypothetical protein
MCSCFRLGLLMGGGGGSSRVQNVVGVFLYKYKSITILFLYRGRSRLVTLLKFTYAPHESL